MTGSETHQKTMPMPIPAWKSMANQAKVLNSGFSSGLPSRILP